MNIRISADDLRARCARILHTAGSSREEAQVVADNLVLANLSGHDSHGVGMLPRYIEAVLEGGLRPNASVTTQLDGGGLLVVDGNRGYGQAIGLQAMTLAIARARAHGSCVMALGNSHHLGRIGHWAEMAVAQGLVAIHFVNVLARPNVAPWGGSDARFGTNPFCVGIPLADQPPFILDLATSRVAQGKMRVAHNERRHVEPGYLVDAAGRPTTDPGVVVVPQANGLFGALLPFGEHKGYGLAIACELLGGALTGGGTLHRAPDGSRAVLNGMFTIVVDPRRLGTQERFQAEAAAFIAWLKESPSESGVKIAGDPERQARERRAREGIEIDPQTWAEILDAGRKVGAPA